MLQRRKLLRAKVMHAASHARIISARYHPTPFSKTALNDNERHWDMQFAVN